MLGQNAIRQADAAATVGPDLAPEGVCCRECGNVCHSPRRQGRFACPVCARELVAARAAVRVRPARPWFGAILCVVVVGVSMPRAVQGLLSRSKALAAAELDSRYRTREIRARLDQKLAALEADIDRDPADARLQHERSMLCLALAFAQPPGGSAPTQQWLRQAQISAEASFRLSRAPWERNAADNLLHRVTVAQTPPGLATIAGSTAWGHPGGLTPPLDEWKRVRATIYAWLERHPEHARGWIHVARFELQAPVYPRSTSLPASSEVSAAPRAPYARAAIRAASRALKTARSASTRAEAAATIAAAYQLLEQHEQALHWCKRATRESPWRTLYWRQLADAHDELGHVRLAEQARAQSEIWGPATPFTIP